MLEIKVPHVNRDALVGQTFYEVFLGVEVYASARSGDSVVVKAADGDLTATIQTVAIGPLGQFLAPSYPHVSHMQRAHDVRAIVDQIEDRYPVSKKGNEKALDPRTIYTALTVTGNLLPVAAAA